MLIVCSEDADGTARNTVKLADFGAPTISSRLFEWPLVQVVGSLKQSVCRGLAGMDAEEEAALAAGEDTQVYGTFEYMSPECYHRDYGQP